MKIISQDQLPKFVLDKRGTRTQVEFAASLGITKQALMQYEKGKTLPRPEILEKLGLSKCYRVNK